MSHMFAFAAGAAMITIVFAEDAGFRFLALIVSVGCAVASTALTLAGHP